MADIDVEALEREVARSREARLRAWTVLQELREILAAAGQKLPEPRERSFVCEGEVLGARFEKGAGRPG